MTDSEHFIESIFKAHYPALESLCRHKTNYNSAYNDLIDETIQEVFLLAYKHYETLKDHPNILGWLISACNHRLIPYAKQQRNRNSRHAFSLDSPGISLPCQADPIDSLIEKNTASQVINSITQELTEKEQEVFDAYFIENQPIQNIAKQKRTTITAVKSVIFRIRQKAKDKNFHFF